MTPAQRLEKEWEPFDGLILENMLFGREQVQRALRRHGCEKSVSSIRRRIEYHKHRQSTVLTLAPQMLSLLKEVRPTLSPGLGLRNSIDALIEKAEGHTKPPCSHTQPNEWQKRLAVRAMIATTSAHEKVPAQGSWVVFSNSIGIGVTAVGGSDVARTRCERFGLHDDSRSRAEDEANAQVMAAARDLFDAADMALNTLLGCCVPAGGVDDRRTMLEAQQMLRKAIRKANGGP